MVSGSVPEQLVDRPEPLQVDAEHVQRVRGPTAPAHGHLEAVEQEVTVGQVGHRVVERLVVDVLLVRELRPEVLDVDQPRVLEVGRLEVAERQSGGDGTVGTVEPRLALVPLAAAGEHLLDRRVVTTQVVAVDERLLAAASHRLGCDAEQVGHGVVRPDHAMTELEECHADGGLVERALEAPLEVVHP